jgi:hypothetical protein
MNKWIDEVVARVISQRVEAAVSAAVAEQVKEVKINYQTLAEAIQENDAIDYAKLGKSLNPGDIAANVPAQDIAEWIEINYSEIEINYSDIEIDYDEIRIDYDEIKIDYDEVPINYQMLGRALVNLASQAKVSTAS